MSCFLQDTEPGKITAVLTFKRDQLLYDIANGGYVEAHVMPDDAEHIRHMVADICEGGNSDRVTRTLDLAVAHCRELLYPFTKRDADRLVLDDRFKERPSYGIVLNIPYDFSQTTLTLLERLIHEYLVATALADWLSITNPDKARVWAEKATDAESELRTTVHSRMKRTRIKPHWL